jgi:aromatic ring-opening dioxygenase LigB subunit
VHVELAQDQGLAHTLADLGSGLGLPMAPFWFGDGTLPLDWSSIVPLRYLGAGFRPRPQLVVVGTSAQVPREQLVEFGRLVHAVADRSPRRIALVASVDQGHAHAADGPYGYNPASAIFDALLQEIVRSGRLEQLLAIDDELEAAAMPDSLQALLVLYGAVQGRPFSCQLRSYELFHYFSGLCATIDLAPAPAITQENTDRPVSQMP